MARRRNTFKFDTRSQTRYPWELWTNGETWEVKSGVDFNCTPESFVIYLYHKARDINMKVQTSTLPAEGDKPVRIVFRFYKPVVRLKKPKQRKKR